MKSPHPFLMSLLIFLTFSSTAFALADDGQKSTAENFIENLDPDSRAILLRTAANADVSLKQLKTITFPFSTSESVVAVDDDANSRMSAEKRDFLFLLGAGVGLVDHFGFTATVLRRNRAGRLTWFAEGDMEYLQARFGYAPNDFRIGIGIHPFRNPVLRAALKVTHSSYTDKFGVGPQLTYAPFSAKSPRVSFNIRLGTAVYFGEPNARGASYSLISDLKFGISIRLFHTSEEGNSK